VLIVTGGAPGPSAATEAAAMRAGLEAAGVPPSAIREEPRARDTVENALLSIPLVRAEGDRRPLLVTDAVHMPRAWLIFRLLGLRCRPAAVPARPAPLRLVKEAAALPVHGARAVWIRLRRGTP
jgi:uncharacterized SAM-binding protein YcdF (DUF218 family)